MVSGESRNFWKSNPSLGGQPDQLLLVDGKNQLNLVSKPNSDMSEPHPPHPSSVDDIDLSTLTVQSVQQGLVDGRFTAESLAQRCVAQIETFNASFNAVVFMNPGALDDASEIDRRRQS